MVRLPHQAAAQILGVLGSAAILVGSVLALRQARLKLLIAYSTVAQIGYLFIMFPLAAGPGPTPAGMDVALAGGMFQAISHAFAKAAMFLAAGLIAGGLGHDRIAGLRGIGRVLPVTVFAFGIAALSLIVVPPSGGFVTKWLLTGRSRPASGVVVGDARGRAAAGDTCTGSLHLPLPRPTCHRCCALRCHDTASW
jgi:formate hydrogenlyase subunit 3/multisubunit Na+/H+ antiporter MnhD subunit